jgi:hypothetical protein
LNYSVLSKTDQSLLVPDLGKVTPQPAHSVHTADHKVETNVGDGQKDIPNKQAPVILNGDGHEKEVGLYM